MYEDLPSLIVPADNEADLVRLDYTSEIERETIAELNSSHFSANWIYYGISVLGIRDRIGTDASGSMRLHFNILMKNILSDDFLDVCEFRNEATESFENSRLIGLKPIKASVLAELGIGWILDHGDLLTNLLLILYVIYTRLAEGHVPDFSDYAMTKAGKDLDSRLAMLTAELHGSLWSMSRRMRNAGRYGAYPNAILQLMYLLDIMGDTIEK